MATPEAEAAKQIAEQGPFVWSNLIPTLWMMAVAMAGGVLSFIQKVRDGKARALNFAELAGEMFISAFVGLVTFWICKAFSVDQYLTAAGVGVAGHMGARAIFLLEQYIENKAKKVTQ